LKNGQQIELNAYHSAIVRIATVRDRADRTNAHLVFASVELITSTRPTPDSLPVDTKGVPQVYGPTAAGLDYAYRRVAMSAEAAVEWYRALHHNPTLPMPMNDDDKGRHDGRAIKAADLVDEPAWPSLSMPLADPSLFGSADDFYPTPFIGPGAYPSRVHRQSAPLTPLLARVIDDSEAASWLRRRLHFDIRRHDELVGGAVLVVPDPDVRAVQTFMTRDADGQEHLVGQVLARRGGTLRGLSLTLFEERFGAMHLFETFKVEGTLMVVRATDQLEHTGYALSHVHRGLVDQQKALPYLRTINIGMGVVGRRVRIETQDSRGKGAANVRHDIDELVQTANSVVGLERDVDAPRDVASRFYVSSERRRQQRIARQQDLQWFDRRYDALRYIRDRIGHARRTIFIVDPYADGRDLFDFGHFVTRRDIKLRLLTSRLPFDRDEEARVSFGLALRSFAERSVPVPEIRILRGGRNPAIHDRFLVIDDDVWLSGNSLNAIGERASVMLKLPDPSVVRERLERLFEDAQPLQLSGERE